MNFPAISQQGVPKENEIASSSARNDASFVVIARVSAMTNKSGRVYERPSRCEAGREQGDVATRQSVLSIKYAKTGDIRFISHLDLMRLFHRAVRRAGLPVEISQGFHSRPRITFGAALKLGKESMNECASFKLTVMIDSVEFTKRLQEQLPEGIKILEVTVNESR